MATRFGAVSPTKRYATKVRWVIAGLLSVIAVLLVAIITLTQSPATANTSQTPSVAQPALPVPAAGSKNILVASTRVEEGTELKPHMFLSRAWSEEMPEGAFTESDREQVNGKFAKHLISANMPLLRDDVADFPPISALTIPPGFRAVTIEVDARSGVEGFAKPNSRVDVLLTYSDENRNKKVATIVRFSKVLSVAGLTSTDQARTEVNNGGKTTVTLLVTEKDAKKVELARTTGALSLTLVGNEETRPAQDDPDVMNLQKMLDIPQEAEPDEPATDGKMYMTDPATGKQVRYVLRKGRWVQDSSF
jgi:pilus assembly protein CpaB